MNESGGCGVYLENRHLIEEMSFYHHFLANYFDTFNNKYVDTILFIFLCIFLLKF